jgi:hypothetical protein
MSEGDGVDIEMHERLRDEMLKYDTFWNLDKIKNIIAAMSNHTSEMSTLVLTRLEEIIKRNEEVIDQREIWILLFVLNRGGVICNTDPWSDMTDIYEIPTDTNLLSVEVLESPVEIPDVSILPVEVLEPPVEIPVEILESPVEIPDVPALSIEVLEPPVEISVEQSALTLLQTSYEEDAVLFDLEISAMLNGELVPGTCS